MNFLELLFRTLLILASASLRKIPKTNFWPLIWLSRYLGWTFTLVTIMCISPRRGGLFAALYAWFRPLDDILDGEIIMEPSNIADLIADKTALIHTLIHDTLTLREVKGSDRLIVTAFNLAESLGMKSELKRYAKMIWDCMILDYNWRKRKVIPLQSNLETFSRSQDEAIFRLMSIVLGIDPATLDRFTLDKIGIFTRIDWLYDLANDLSIGLVHLSQESCMAHGINYELLVAEPKRFLRNPTLRLVVALEVDNLTELWRQVDKERHQFLAALPNRLLASTYGKVLQGFEDQFLELRRNYPHSQQPRIA